ncbi:MAG TPA: hypothetical protein DCF68_09950 [Cyanothece sp. UBA12306]|nr:hypothetical protein [Cyanothece sp. UBA12306]
MSSPEPQEASQIPEPQEASQTLEPQEAFQRLNEINELQGQVELNKVYLVIINSQHTPKDKINLINAAGESQRKLIDAARKSKPGLEDRQIYRIAVGGLAAGIVLSIIATVILIGTSTNDDNKNTDGLIGIGSACAGALAGLLAPRVQKEDNY